MSTPSRKLSLNLTDEQLKVLKPILDHTGKRDIVATLDGNQCDLGTRNSSLAKPAFCRVLHRTLKLVFYILCGCVVSSAQKTTTCHLPSSICLPAPNNLNAVKGREFVVTFKIDDFTADKNTLFPVAAFRGERLVAASISVRNANSINFDNEVTGFQPRVTILASTSSNAGKVPNGKSGLEPSTSVGFLCPVSTGGNSPVILTFNYGTYDGGDAIFVTAKGQSPCNVGLHVYAVTMPGIQ
jgi:hypothetical protein